MLACGMMVASQLTWNAAADAITASAGLGAAAAATRGLGCLIESAAIRLQPRVRTALGDWTWPRRGGLACARRAACRRCHTARPGQNTRRQRNVRPGRCCARRGLSGCRRRLRLGSGLLCVTETWRRAVTRQSICTGGRRSLGASTVCSFAVCVRTDRFQPNSSFVRLLR